ncbi:hypothetical protein SynROS8604_01227 [Synechococcus sp. ROS8604]|nr:hypothetical protein SynROS8604_01227 [Synechococcus sp. ROS8604]
MCDGFKVSLFNGSALRLCDSGRYCFALAVQCFAAQVAQA